MQVRLTFASGETFSLEAEATWDVLDLMDAIEDATGIHRSQQTLILGSDVLDSSQALGSLCPEQDSADGMDLHLVNDPNNERLNWIKRLRVSLHYSVFRDAPQSIRKDREMVLAAVSGCPLAWYYVEDCFKDDKKVVLAALNKDGSLLQDMSEKVRADRDSVLAAVSRKGKCLEHASEALRADPEVVGAAVANDRAALLSACSSCWTYGLVTDCLQRNGSLLDVTPAMKAHPMMKRLCDDQNFILYALRHCRGVLALASSRLRGDLEVVFEAVRTDGAALEYASAELQSNQDVVLAAIQQRPASLEFASSSLKAAADVVLAAVQQDGTLIRFAAKSLQRDPVVMCAAMRSSCPGALVSPWIC